MATGELTFPVVDESALPSGFVVTSSGRVSGVRHPGEEPYDDSPFSHVDRNRIDRTLTEATRRTRILWTIYIGELGAASADRARELHSTLPRPDESVLIAVSPNEKSIEIVGGDAIGHRYDDRVAQLGASAAVSSFQRGDLIDGLVSAVRVMAAAVSPVRV
ncbi:DUF5130 family protein [Tomitella cavernea]|uniref:DUF5130 domain-containing protein n=1 Tax=Tomitella cavernea TaxID=1387982 RepID=A0ABP9CW91_9ACTN|nr:DUF5130 family protein [Tomitella cavernea]